MTIATPPLPPVLTIDDLPAGGGTGLEQIIQNAVDASLETSLNTALAGVQTQIGTLGSLTTTDKTNLVAALNEAITKIGTLSSLTTTTKTSLVAALNELKASVAAINDTSASSSSVYSSTKVDTLLASKANDSAVVKTTGDQTVAGNKTTSGIWTFGIAPQVPDDSFSVSKVDGLNEALAGKQPAGSYATTSQLGNVTADLGTKSSLTTTDKTSLVNAVNELVSLLATANSNISAKADDSAVVKLTGDQTVAGVKTFSSAPSVPDSAFAIAKTSGLQGALDNRVRHDTASQGLDSTQQSNARTNISALGTSDVVSQTSASERMNLVLNPISSSVKTGYGWVASRADVSVQAGYLRLTINDATASDMSQRLNSRTTTYQAIEPSTVRQFQAKVRSNTGLPCKLTVVFYNSGGTSISSTSSSTVTPDSSSFSLLSVQATTPSTAAYAYLQIGLSGTGARSIGQWLDIKEVFAGDPGTYFDGGMGQVDGAVTRWSGVPNDSTSYASAVPAPLRGVAASSTLVPSSQGVADALSGVRIGEERISVKTFGVRGDGATIDTAAMLEAVRRTRPTRDSPAAGISGFRLTVPPGEYLLDDTVQFYRWAGLFEGYGVGASPLYATAPGNGSVFRWVGANDRPMFKIKDSRHVKVSNMRLEGNDSTPPTYLIECNNLTADSQGHNSNLVFDGLYLGAFTWSSQGTDKGAAAGGIAWTGDNGNNDQFVVRDSFIRGCTTGLYVPNSQSIWGSIENTTIWSCTTGIRSSASLLGKNVRFQLCGTDARSDASAQIDINGWYSEHSGRIMYASSQGRLIARGGQWTLHSDLGTGPFIQHDVAINNAGIVLDGLYIDTALSPFPKIQMTATAASTYLGRLTIRDCRLLMDLSRFDVTTSGSSGVEVNLQYGDYNVRGLRLTGGNTLSAAPSTLSGYGTPEGAVTATPGSTFQRLNGGAGTGFYVKESGTGNTGWVAK